MRDQNLNKFTNSVILCVMELIGKCEVSSKNCSAVIDVVSRHLFDVHIKEKDLPSERNSLRSADKGHILPQHQIADSLLHSCNVDLHSDGTSHDHNKVLGHQFTTNDGKILLCGFAPVFKGDTDTLVDVAFNMLKELADEYDGNEADAAFKVMLKNITGLMKSFDIRFQSEAAANLTY
ncbi:hypothetical protein SNE40_020030 [Patella caerulea]|uniref:Uncharacterized protein n=1 Tax=Patella caerulea TaxID=87958 RepID=A0AAN8J020_PATCE